MPKGNLGYFDGRDKTGLITDASPFGLGAILFQSNKSGVRIIAYASKSLNDQEKKFYHTEKEAYAIFWAINKFHLYLFGVKFDLFTDCKALEFLFKPRSKPCLRLERWILNLQAYDFTVKFIKGQDNAADALSRLCQGTISNDDCDEAGLVQHVRYIAPATVCPSEIEKETVNDQILEQVRRAQRF